MSRRSTPQRDIDDRAFPIRVKVAIPPDGAVRRMRTRLEIGRCAGSQAAQSARHSARAAARFTLKNVRLERLRSELKRLWTEA
jgi:hypothetical protein